jgi:hypothetical protein
MVVAAGFKKLWHSERQELVWRIANRALSRDEDLRISMILTLTPEELGELPREVRERAKRSRASGRKVGELARANRG